MDYGLYPAKWIQAENNLTPSTHRDGLAYFFGEYSTGDCCLIHHPALITVRTPVTHLSRGVYSGDMGPGTLYSCAWAFSRTPHAPFHNKGVGNRNSNFVIE